MLGVLLISMLFGGAGGLFVRGRRVVFASLFFVPVIIFISFTSYMGNKITPEAHDPGRRELSCP